MTVSVRPARPDELDAAAAVWLASDTARRGSPLPSDKVDEVRRRFDLPDVWVLAVQADDEIVGVTQGMPARRDFGAGTIIDGLCHLSLVFVLPNRWGQGIGTQLVVGAFAEARRRGYQRLQLFTHEDNERARRLYAGQGLTRTGLVIESPNGGLVGHWERDL